MESLDARKWGKVSISTGRLVRPTRPYFGSGCRKRLGLRRTKTKTAEGRINSSCFCGEGKLWGMVYGTYIDPCPNLFHPSIQSHFKSFHPGDWSCQHYAHIPTQSFQIVSSLALNISLCVSLCVRFIPYPLSLASLSRPKRTLSHLDWQKARGFLSSHT